MRSQPGISLRGRESGVDVRCACGGVLVTLAPGEAVYPKGVLVRSLFVTQDRQGACGQCGAKYSIPVTTMVER